MLFSTIRIPFFLANLLAIISINKYVNLILMVASRKRHDTNLNMVIIEVSFVY